MTFLCANVFVKLILDWSLDLTCEGVWSHLTLTLTHPLPLPTVSPERPVKVFPTEGKGMARAQKPPRLVQD